MWNGHAVRVAFCGWPQTSWSSSVWSQAWQSSRLSQGAPPRGLRSRSQGSLPGVMNYRSLCALIPTLIHSNIYCGPARIWAEKNVSRAPPLSRTTTKAGGIHENLRALTCEHSRCSSRAALRGSGWALMVLVIHLILHLQELSLPTELQYGLRLFCVHVCEVLVCAHRPEVNIRGIYFSIAFQLIFWE